MQPMNVRTFTPTRILSLTVFAAAVSLAPHSAGAVAPADTPIEPIPASAIELSLYSDEMAGTCTAYAAVGDWIYGNMSTEDGDVFMEAIDQWTVDGFEEGWEDPGTSARMTDEAEVVFLDFLHGCL